MTLVLELPDDVQERLRRYAQLHGLTEEAAIVEWVKTLPEPTAIAEVSSEIKPPFPNLVAYISPDFADPLSDEFWLGDEVNDPIYK